MLYFLILKPFLHKLKTNFVVSRITLLVATTSVISYKFSYCNEQCPNLFGQQKNCIVQDGDRGGNKSVGL